MELTEIRQNLNERVVAVPTTIWTAPGELDLEANAANAAYIFENGIRAAVYAGGVGEHDRLSVEQQRSLLTIATATARQSGAQICVGTGLGRTADRVKQLAPTLGTLGVSFAMLMPPPIADEDEQFVYYSEVIGILNEHKIGPMLYARPEHPMSARLIERLFDRFEIPGVKLANNELLPVYAEMVGRLGHDRSAWICGTAGWWMPAYASVGAARGMSTGIGNAFPEKPLDLLQSILTGRFQPDRDYWAMVRLEQIRLRDRSYVALVIKRLQELVGLRGGMNGDGATLPDAVSAEVESLVRTAGWIE
jgi:dihydrodipicolinate synthase/N-acetylneuraminate lyase